MQLSDDKKVLIRVKKDEIIDGTIRIPDSVREIGQYAFMFYKGLTSLTFPKELIKICDRAFDGCSGLTSLTFPAGLKEIGEAAFYCCYRLTSLMLPDGLTKIADRAFENCCALTSLTLPDELKEVGKHAFGNCNSLTSLIFPEGLIKIDDSAFSGCDALKQIIINTNSKTEFNRIRALLPKELRTKARSMKDVIGDFHSSLNKLTRCPEVSSLYLSEQMGDIPELNPDIRVLIESYQLDDNPYYRQVKSYILALPNLCDSDALDGNKKAVSAFVDKVIEQAKRDHQAALVAIVKYPKDAVPAKNALGSEHGRAESSAKLKLSRSERSERVEGKATGFFDSPNTKANDNNAQPPESDMSVDEESQRALNLIKKS